MIREYALCQVWPRHRSGSTQIRNAGTIGGNAANASPCADGVTALTALGAEVTTLDGTGTLRTRPIHEVVLGPNCTDLAHDEAIVEFTFPAYGPDYRSAFAKIGSRTTVSVARVSAALRVRIDAEAGVLSEVYAALGAVGDTAFRATRLEQVLAGRPANEETARIFAEGCGSGRGINSESLLASLQTSRRGGSCVRRLEYAC